MKLLQFLLKIILEVLKGVTYKWILSLIYISERILQALKGFCARRKVDHFDKTATNTGCGLIHHTSFHRPDPLIYSQKYLLSLGLAVTWDNPDIDVLKNGVVVSESNLLPNTEYEIRATIWNNSYDAPVVGLVVDFSYLSFGVGTTSHPIATKVINLGVKGGVNHPAHASIMWTTPAAAGHYCILVDLKCADDLNPNNNVGQNNVDVVAAHSPATFTFQLKNNTNIRRVYRFAADTYTLPELKDCGERISKPRDNGKKWKQIQTLHNRNNYQVPPDWTVAMTPLEASLIPGEEVGIEVNITPPNAFTGRKAFNVHAILDNGKYAGGVTAYVSKP
jgi:hypothetical protein